MTKTLVRRLGLSRVDVTVAGALLLLALMIGWSIRSDSLQRERTFEAANFLSEVYRCQRQHLDQHGNYADSLAELDLRLPIPTAFDLKPLVRTEDGWSLIATQQGAHDSRPTVLSIDQFGWSDRTAGGTAGHNTTGLTMASDRASARETISNAKLTN